MPSYDIHLCQPDSRKSCGACCGIYNYADSSREALTKRLIARTEAFQRIVKSKNDLATYAEHICAVEDGAKRFEVIYCCEFVSFLDEGESRVGCLLHPVQNDDDWRDVSFYGRELCDGHFCPSYHYISDREKLCLLNVCDDWYLYGLCVTDIDLVKEYFRHISERIFEATNSELIKISPLKDIVLEFFSWKESWRFRSSDVQRLGKYYFDGSQYMISQIDYKSLMSEHSRYDKIFVSLTSHFNSGAELKEAEDMIDDNITRFVDAYMQMRLER